MRESRRVLVSLAALLVGLVVVNVIATMFYRSTGGFGYLDLNGGANLLDSRPPTHRRAPTPCSRGTARRAGPATPY
jgi:hypothetical protein